MAKTKVNVASKAEPMNAATLEKLVRLGTAAAIQSAIIQASKAMLAAKSDMNSPDRDILTPTGCRLLLGVGEKALVQLMRRGLPNVEISNSYRFHRAEVLRWMADESRTSRQ